MAQPSQPSQPDPQASADRAYTWILSAALVVTVLFSSFAVYFSRSVADTLPTEAEIANATPTIASVVISTDLLPGTLSADTDYDTPSSIIGTQGSLTPTAGSTLSAYVHIIARDMNGWQDIDPDSGDPGSIAYTGFIVRSTRVEACTTANDFDCYTPFSFSNCTKIASGVNVIQIRCPVSLTYYTTPGTWDLSVTIADRAGATVPFASTYTVNPLLAYTVNTATVDFGTVTLPFAGVTNSNKEVVFTNVGNTGVVQLQVDHSAMTCVVGASTSGGSIPASNLAYSAAAIASLAGSYTTGLAAGTPFTFSIPSQTNATLITKTLFNHLVAVPSGTAGSCAGTITLTPSS